jgi:hypothetical protein
MRATSRKIMVLSCLLCNPPCCMVGFLPVAGRDAGCTSFGFGVCCPAGFFVALRLEALDAGYFFSLSKHLACSAILHAVWSEVYVGVCVPADAANAARDAGRDAGEDRVLPLAGRDAGRDTGEDGVLPPAGRDAGCTSFVFGVCCPASFFVALRLEALDAGYFSELMELSCLLCNPPCKS